MWSNWKSRFWCYRSSRCTQEPFSHRQQWRNLISIRFPIEHQWWSSLIKTIFTHQNWETSGFESVSIVRCTSFNAIDLYKTTSSPIDFEWVVGVVEAFWLSDTECKNEDKTDFLFRDWLDDAEEIDREEDDAEFSADDRFRLSAWSPWRWSGWFSILFQICLIFFSTEVRSLRSST